MSIPPDVAAARHISLTTYRKNGAPVATPVWLAPDGERLVVWTDPASGKVKRLRHTAHVTLSVSDSRGRVPHDAPRHQATAQLLGVTESRAARRALARRYLLVRLTDLATRLLPRTARPGIALAITFPS
ncbi:PPOX class F420-dependent oxidoreductase [Streptomyces bauhiniae]|uniref:PPOX class F420-dependent oxidoreductase n=1 Tax=Streptomyces bauhiniae TaxID=2340725 RepID=A0A4Z1D367_9ACTN|nr:PPOX class F420-dependent oxidoreductase [Streptomyces bauhiniae]TGN76520.1 PPOX class F420-dependent oxidoreductase [Streptomyces bauhiniae]